MDLPIRERAGTDAVEEITTVGRNIPTTSGFVEIADNIFEWGIARGITLANGATPQSQLAKLEEEFDELRVGVENNNRDLIADSIGDMYVVLQQVARLSGIPMQECIEAAWDDIKDRKGSLRFGIFFKQDDIDLIGEVAFGEARTAEQLLDWIAVAKESYDEQSR